MKSLPALSASDKKLLTTFEAHYFSDIPEDDVEKNGAYAEEVINNHFKLALKRANSSHSINIYNREPENKARIITIIDIVTADKPFIVDSVRMVFNQMGIAVNLVMHPIFHVQRDKQNKLTGLAANNTPHNFESSQKESFVHCEIDDYLDEKTTNELRKKLAATLENVDYAVSDWQKMLQQLNKLLSKLETKSIPLPSAELEQATEFLRWLKQEHFLFLGYCYFDVKAKGDYAVYTADQSSQLGVLRHADNTVMYENYTTPADDLKKRFHLDNYLVLTKSVNRSKVHRPAHYDIVSIRKVNDKGKIIGEYLFWGLFTSTAYASNADNIPYVNNKIDYVIKTAGYDPVSHTGKALRHALDTFPKDELFAIDKKLLLKFSKGMLHLTDQHKVKLFIREDRYQRYITCFIFVPRDVFDSKLRKKIISEIERAYETSEHEFKVKITDDGLARIELLLLTNPQDFPKVNIKRLEQKIIDLSQSWQDKLKNQLYETIGNVEGNKCFRKFAEVFSPAYINQHSVNEAVKDIYKLKELLNSEFNLMLRLNESDQDGHFHLKLFNKNNLLTPSDVLPILENMGVKVIQENPYQLIFSDESQIWIHDYLLRFGEQKVDIEKIEEHFKNLFANTWNGDVENDGFNELVLKAGLSYREIACIRAYCKYLMQARVPFSQQYMQQTLISNTAIIRDLSELFIARFNPARHSSANKRKDSHKATAELTNKIESALENVASLDEDRILRNFFAAILATVRTNFYQTDEQSKSKPYISFKFDTSKVLELPEPRPMFEIFVYSPRTEGVHLRGGKVARGGLRWSDRREDFRTEILGLVKAQMVKNSVIVPVGAKGGFVMKQPPTEGGRDAIMQEVVNCYRSFINALLDVTDNIVNDRVEPPKEVVRYDEDDTYLVVAADKGTATFSDIANSIAIERNFWLGDAFASGGSIGYDHKKMGITARGAWESVKLNFRDIGKNIQKEDFTVVGIGDMAGDVFGNGMLLSRHIKLIAAFNHMHIFLDPDPDPESTWKERKRLFELPRSSWADYNSKLISKGGGIFERSMKSISLSSQIRKALDIEEKSLSPNELINRILKSPVDLLWNGGIGTYVKSSQEQHTDVGDKANDNLRINGNELRCFCVGEGGNLGMTQKARIEYALNGGIVDTDFIHNAGGVDCSDHEVNIKILLNQLINQNLLTEKKRVKLLADMTDEVADLVLQSNYWQGQAITQINEKASDRLDEHARYIRSLERAGVLSRELESLPDEESIHERKNNGIGLTRPEIAVLVSYAKLQGFDKLLNSDLWDDPYFANELLRYFPKQLQKKFSAQIHQHKLRNEILATFIINRLVNRMGAVFIYRMQQETGASTAEVTRAYTIAWEVFDLRHLWMRLSDPTNNIPGKLQTEMMLTACLLIERTSRWLIQNRRNSLQIKDTIERYRDGFNVLSEMLPHIDGVRNEELYNYYKQDTKADLAAYIASMDALYSTFDIVEISKQLKTSVEQVSKIYFSLAEYVGIFWLRDKVTVLHQDNQWQERANRAMIDDIYNVLRQLTRKVITSSKQPDPMQAIDNWHNKNKQQVDHYLDIKNELQNSDNIEPAMVSVALRELSTFLNSD